MLCTLTDAYIDYFNVLRGGRNIYFCSNGKSNRRMNVSPGSQMGQELQEERNVQEMLKCTRGVKMKLKMERCMNYMVNSIKSLNFILYSILSHTMNHLLISWFQLLSPPLPPPPVSPLDILQISEICGQE